jgi:small subunit ribosomal protein S7e
MLSWRKKILKQKGAAPTELEQQVAQALFDLEGSSSDLANEVKDLWILAAKEITCPSQKQSIILFVPYVKLAAFHKIQHLLVPNLEKKFNGKHVRLLRSPYPSPFPLFSVY